MNRKNFLKLLALMGVSSLPTTAYAREETNESGMIPFTEDLAEYIALIFAKENCTTSAYATSIQKIVDWSGAPYGYCISFSSNGMPSGYVVLNPKTPGIIEEFCFENNISGPMGTGSMAKSTTECNQLLIRQGPATFTYIAQDDQDSIIGRSYNPTSWENLMIYEDQINDEYYDGPYMLTDSTDISGFTYISKYLTESQLKKYACTVNALCSIATKIPTSSGSYLMPHASLSSHFNEIWQKTGTIVDHTANGVQYGITYNEKAGPGFVSYASAHGVSLKSTFLNSKPPLQRFKDHVNAKKFSVVHATIKEEVNGQIKDSGHAMAVRGTAILKRGPLSLPCLHVFDGWYRCVYLNYASSDYVNVQGTFFD